MLHTAIRRLRTNDPADTKLDLSAKSLGDDGLLRLLPHLAHNSTVRHLCLANNSLTDRSGAVRRGRFRPGFR